MVIGERRVGEGPSQGVRIRAGGADHLGEGVVGNSAFFGEKCAGVNLVNALHNFVILFIFGADRKFKSFGFHEAEERGVKRAEESAR